MAFSMRRVALQLDYHMSTQFAGVAVAMQRGLCPAAGIDLTILPTCPPGQEPAEVHRAHQQAVAAGEKLTVVGSAEQNVLVADLRSSGTPVSAVAAMFGASPLALAGLPGSSIRASATVAAAAAATPAGLRIGAHIDTVDLLQRLVPHAQVLPVSREDKLQLLRQGEIDAVQVYDVMETLRLHADLGAPPEIVKLEELFSNEEGPPNLGYSQVLFAPNDALSCSAQRDDVRRLCDVIFEGWKEAIRDPEGAARDVAALVPRGTLGELEGAGHWRNSQEFLTRSVVSCCEYVKQTRRGGMLGTIDPARWDRANIWLQSAERCTDADTVMLSSGLDSSVYSLDSRWMSGHDVAAALSQKVRADAAVLRSALGRRPSLLVVSVGTEALGHGHTEASTRLEQLSARTSSWYSKASTGEAHGCRVRELHLPVETTTEQLQHILRGVQIGGGGGFVGNGRGGDGRSVIYDGVQLMWPMPDHIDARAAFSVIPREADVDGAHWIGDLQLAQQRYRHQENPDDTSLLPPESPAHEMAPVTSAAVMDLLAYHGFSVAGTRALVVGRSRIVGQPLAHALSDAGATVTLARSTTSAADLKQAVGCAELVVSCVGVPGLIHADWLQPGATAISVGSTLTDDGLVGSDIEGLELSRTVGRFADAPGGVGPIAVLKLLENVVIAARAATVREAAARSVGTTEVTPAVPSEELQQAIYAMSPAGSPDGWKLDSSGRLVHSFWLPSYPCAVSFVQCISTAAEGLNHHPDSLSISHRCVDGVDVDIALATLSIGGAITASDLALARAIMAAYTTRQQLLVPPPRPPPRE